VGVVSTIAFFVPIRALAHLQASARRHLRWQLTSSYVLMSLLVTVLLPLSFIFLGVIAVGVGVLALPVLGIPLGSADQAATAVAPLVQRQASSAELTSLLQGMLDGSTRLPPTVAEPPSSDAANGEMTVTISFVSLANAERLSVVQVDNQVLASVGTDAFASGSTLPPTLATKVAALRAQTRNVGCIDGTPAKGLQADVSVCPLRSTNNALIAHLIVETSSQDAAAFDPDTPQLMLMGFIGAGFVLLLTPLTLIVILPVAGGFVGYRSASRLTKRIERLTTAAGDIAAGNLQRRVEIDLEDEVARLANDFNTMAAKLAEREYALADAAQRAEHLLRANKRLVADVSHELRTPLTTVRGYLEALAHEHGDKLPQRDLQVIESELQRLTHLIEDLFTLARTEAHQLPLQIAPTDACALATKLVDALAPLARRERQIEVIAALPTELPLVCADQTRLEQVLQNLIQNALRYTPAGGIVALEATATDDHVTLAVADTGMGIAPDELPRVWERFYRSDRSRARETGGAGLGLALVKELVTAMGGTVSAESTLGRGSKFSITLRCHDHMS
jgi:signal transduction histidine kinase